MTKLIVTSTKNSNSVEFYKDVSVMNHVLNEYVLENKLLAVTKISEDNLTKVTTMTFISQQAYTEFCNDPVIIKFGKIKKEYNLKHGIIQNTELKID